MTDPRARVLVVEDERAQRDALQRYLVRQGHEVEGVTSAEEALLRLKATSFDVLITDLRLPGVDGLELVRRARDLDPELGVLLITAFASVDSAVESLRLGANDYLLKPLILEEVGQKVGRLVTHRELVRENARLRQALRAQDREVSLVAQAPAMREVTAWLPRAAATRANVLVTGETGTGKEVIAREIHRLGSARDEPFLAVNIAAVPEAMIESHLFGHEQGAFTGAVKRREGLLRAAGKGTVFLDEIAELDLGLQAKLLRAIEAREVQPLGSDHTVTFEARIIAATHRDIDAMARGGRFREDLFYRLNVVRIRLPPLRDRPEDIPALVRDLVARHATRAGTLPPVVTGEALRALCRHPWRGNVRELSNVLERALIVADEGRIDVDQLPDDVRGEGVTSMALEAAVEAFERRHIATVLRLAGGNREQAAVELGVSPATLYRRIERLGLKGFEVHRGAEGEAVG